MKTHKLITGSFVLALAILNVNAFGQGVLTPPGAPAPTMKSLDQIEPRTPISSAPFNISQSGSYYLTANLTASAGSAININANNVTLDLNGFTISSTENPAGPGIGIHVGQSLAVTNVSIVNGFISSAVVNNGGTYGGIGFGYGIYGFNPGCYNVRVKDVTVSGVRYDGIYLGSNPGATAVANCIVNTAGDTGIFAQTVFDSTALNCGNVAINATLANSCYGDGVNNITYKYNMP